MIALPPAAESARYLEEGRKRGSEKSWGLANTPENERVTGQDFKALASLHSLTPEGASGLGLLVSTMV
jgi:hypothetical protein